MLAKTDPLALEEGDTISGKVHCHRRKDNARHLDILLEYALTKKGAQQSGEVKFQNFSLQFCEFNENKNSRSLECCRWRSGFLRRVMHQDIVGVL